VIAIGVLLLLVGGGAGWFFVAHRHTAAPTPAEQNVADRRVDAVPLTTAEVFGAGAIPSSLGGGQYTIVKTQGANDCNTAAGGDIATALAAAGCTQVVRATLTSPDGAYVITAGIFNLTDAAKASVAQTAIKAAISAKTGRFSGLLAGGSTNVIAVAAANVAWEAHGHYLIYCLISKTDGSAIAASDSPSHSIITDVVTDYLAGTVIHKREISSTPAVGSSQPS
jgi:hypothetical protein